MAWRKDEYLDGYETNGGNFSDHAEAEKAANDGAVERGFNTYTGPNGEKYNYDGERIN